ncbi:MAG: ABC transporter permease [Armatimonadota bacterium]|nr:ABC transporter permease [Armatimonadota bacterium]MDR7428472.1 ABC transporter permease [Armatimonadota bacterium]MDR7464941.1 ABC transporter permease [Armatimonadota bacterium]MDR7469658.1 ABC transporter permease [Armatimonadota bacterium]MDR7474911.1 ABC transporter permease [Armatimonadota bacterium]
MRLVISYFAVRTLELARLPAYVMPTLIFPAMIFVFFAVPQARDPSAANLGMASFIAFAVLGVAFFQFGVGIASERRSPWETYLRTLAVTPLSRFLSRVLSALAFAVAAGGIVVLTAVILTPVRLSIQGWLRLGAAVLAGSVPFAFLGISLGYWAHPRGALPLANLLYLLLSYAGGLWVRPHSLPAAVARLSPLLPTRLYGEVVWSAALEIPWRADHWFWLGAYALLFAFLAVAGYLRDEGERYR